MSALHDNVMRAAHIPVFGDADVLRIRDMARPTPGDRELLVRIHATALNRADILQRRGRYAAPAGEIQDIPGIEFAGEVAARGAGASRWAVGDRVFSIVPGGAHAQFVVMHEDAVAPIPESLNWTEAAAIPEAFITAHDALYTQAQLKTGETLLVHAAGSGVGLAAIQLGVAVGARVFGTTRSADKLDAARGYGLSDGVVLTDGPAALPHAVEDWTSGRGVDVVLDLVGGAYATSSLDVLASGGRLMLIGAIGGARAELNVLRAITHRLRIQGSVLRSRALPERIVTVAAFARDVLPLLARGIVRPVVDSTFVLDDIVEAHRRLESNQTFGKVVITCT